MNSLAQLIEFSNTHALGKYFKPKGLGKTVIINSNATSLILPFVTQAFLFNCVFSEPEVHNPFSTFSCPYNFFLMSIDELDTIVVDNPKEIRYIIATYLSKVKGCILISRDVDILSIKEVPKIEITEIPHFYCVTRKEV